MPKLKIAAGDSVARLAGAAGVAPDTVWSHPDNARLKARRDHMDVLAVGDVLTVPEPEAKTQQCATGKRHRFRRHGVPMRFTLQLLDEAGQPRKGRPFRLEVDGTPQEGSTDGDGVVQVYLPTAARQGVLVVDDLMLQLAFGVLEPKSGLAGVRATADQSGVSVPAGCRAAG